MKTLARGLQVLDKIIDAGRALGITEIATELELDKSSVSRLVKTLVNYGYVQADNNSRGYVAGKRVRICRSRQVLDRGKGIAVGASATCAAGREIDIHGCVRGRIVGGIRARATVETVGPGTAGERVVAVAAADHVVGGAAIDDVVAGTAGEGVAQYRFKQLNVVQRSSGIVMGSSFSENQL